MRENCTYGLMRGAGLLSKDNPKRARSWKRRIQPRVGLKQAEPVLYSTQLSMKLRCKIRKGSRLIRRYDTPRTPFERVVESRKGDPKKLAVLKHTLKTTDPFELSARIDQQLERIYKLASHADRAPRERPPLKQTPWRNWTFSKKLQRQQQDMKRQMREDFQLLIR